MKKIALFSNLELGEIQTLLKAGRIVQFRADEQIYYFGNPSDEMLVLLKGRLCVLAESGEELAQIRPGTPTGEMGLFTGQPRSATIVASQASTALVLGRKEIGLVLAANREMQIKVLQNLVQVLCQRLTEANELNDAQARTIRDLEKKLPVGDVGEEDEEHGDEDDDEDDYYDDDEEEDDASAGNAAGG